MYRRLYAPIRYSAAAVIQNVHVIMCTKVTLPCQRGSVTTMKSPVDGGVGGISFPLSGANGTPNEETSRFTFVLLNQRGSTVVKVLRHKSE